MFVIDEAKLPPPTPASTATTRKVVYEVPGSMTIAREDGRDEQQGGADDRPVPAAELRDGEGVRHPHHGADQRRHRDQEELAGRRRSRTPGP